MTAADWLTVAAVVAALLCYAAGGVADWHGHRVSGWLFWLAGFLCSCFAAVIAGRGPIP